MLFVPGIQEQRQTAGMPLTVMSAGRHGQESLCYECAGAPGQVWAAQPFEAADESIHSNGTTVT